jgi:ureidoacrylate peracid hydrolase
VNIADGTALLLADLQNDFLAPGGAYGRAGVTSPELSALGDRMRPVVQAARAAGVPIISTQFTLIPVRGGEPLIAAHLAERRPFLGEGDFAPGSWGHDLVDDLAPADVVVAKVAFSAFHASPLEYVLRSLGVSTLIVSGILTNGGVASTVRDAHVHGFETWLIDDGCADLTVASHEAALASLAGVSQIVDCASVLAGLDARTSPSA